ncbi:MAG: DsbC family protein [Nitrospirota bacterium]
MHKILFFVIITFSLLPMSYSYGFSEKSQDCSKCHTLAKDEASTLLKDMAPNLKVIDIKTIPVKGMWEVDIDAGGKKGLLYVDFSKKYLISGAVVSIKDKKNLTQKRLTELNKVDVSKIPLDDALVIGNKDAKHRVIVFDDPDCPFCAKLHQEMKKVIEKRKDIAFYIKMFPLKIHPEAYEKSKAIVCEKSLTLLEDAFEKKQLPKPKCETSAIDDNLKLGEKLGISGTPALIMPDGRVISGYKEADAIIDLVGN